MFVFILVGIRVVGCSCGLQYGSYIVFNRDLDFTVQTLNSKLYACYWTVV